MVPRLTLENTKTTEIRERDLKLFNRLVSRDIVFRPDHQCGPGSPSEDLRSRLASSLDFGHGV